MDPFDDDMDGIDMREIPTGGPSRLHLDILKKHFGHENFRPMQWRIIEAILDRRDNFAVMATGYGKSLCFQYPPVFLEGIALVVSPLISLMEDQVLSLNVSNIPACFLGSAQSDRNVLRDVLQKKYRIVYVTPEYITGETGDRLVMELKQDLTLIAIDEAHCVSQWGHDFRPAYRKLDTLRNKVLGVPMIAVTATATVSVRNDIIRVLHLRDPLISCSGFDRPNLEFHVHLKTSLGAWHDLRSHLRGSTTGSIIIYCLTRKQTEDIANLLQSNGLICEAYHAGLTVKQRRTVHEKFVRDQVQIICATIAFGMGIDKPDVRLVVHYGASKDIESYYQEVGRAGRDGQPSKCVMFYNRADFATHANLREVGNLSNEMKKNLEKLSEKMWDYLNTRECRRLFILRYFEGDAAKCEKRKNCCDNCDRNMKSSKDCDKYEGLDQEGKYDFSDDTKKLLGAIQIYKGQKGLNASVLTLRGSKAKSVPEYAQKLPLFGAGKDKPEEWWKSLGLLLEREGYLKKEAFDFNSGFQPKFKNAMQRTIVTQKGNNWLQSTSSPLKLTPTAEMFPMLKRKQVLPAVNSSPSTSTSNPLLKTNQSEKLTQELVQLLLQKRAEVASALDIMPHMVASQAAIYKIAKVRPLNLDEFRAAQLDGFNEIKISKFGPKFLKVIQEKLNYLPSSLTASKSGETKRMNEILKYNPVSNIKLTSAIGETFDKFKRGMSVEEIAQERNVQPGTVNGYLGNAILCGLPMTKSDIITRLNVDEATFEHIKSQLPVSFKDGVTLKSIKDSCLPHITWDAVRLVTNYYHVRWHLDQLGEAYVDPDKITTPVTPKNTKNAPTTYKSPEQMLLDDDQDDLLLAAEAQVADKIFAMAKNDNNDCFNDDDDLLLVEATSKIDNIERVQCLPRSQLDDGKRGSTSDLTKFENQIKKPKIKGTLDIAYDYESSDDDENGAVPVTQSVSSDGWLNKNTVQSTAKSSGFVKKARSKLF